MEEKIKQHLCRVCGESKPLTEFHKCKAKKDGLQNICKNCSSKQHKKYYERHKERIDERTKKYNEEHREELRESSRKYREIYREKEKERQRKYKDSHQDELKEQSKKYRGTHKDEIKARNRKWWQSPNGKFAAQQHSHRRRVQEHASSSDLTSKQWQRILKNQQNRCSICQKMFNAHRVPTMDHIIPLSKGGTHDSSNVQALCQSCNSSKNAKILKCFINSWCL